MKQVSTLTRSPCNFVPPKKEASSLRTEVSANVKEKDPRKKDSFSEVLKQKGTPKREKNLGKSAIKKKKKTENDDDTFPFLSFTIFSSFFFVGVCRLFFFFVRFKIFFFCGSFSKRKVVPFVLNFKHFRARLLSFLAFFNISFHGRSKKMRIVPQKTRSTCAPNYGHMSGCNIFFFEICDIKV